MSSIGEYLVKNNKIDENNGSLEVEFIYKESKCSSKEISGPIVDQYIGYYLIIQDLHDVKVWLDKIDESHPNEGKQETESNRIYDVIRYKLTPDNWNSNGMLVKSLFYSCIVIYAKCFTQAKGRKIKLERKNIESKLHKRHDLIMEYRNTIVAHSGEGRWDSGQLYVLHTPKEFLGKEALNIHIEPITNRLDYEDDRNSVDSFRSLVEHVITKVEEKKKSVFEKILKEMIYPKGQEYWYK